MADARINSIQTVLRILHHVQRYPGMYFRPTDPGQAEAFLHGVTVGVGAAIETTPYQTFGREALVTARGCQYRSVSPAVEMAEKGLAQHAIVGELIAIEIAGWRRLLSGMMDAPPAGE